MRFYFTAQNRAQKTLRDTSQNHKERGQKPRDLVNVIINQFEEIIYGQKLPEDRILKAETETRAKPNRNYCKISKSSQEAAIQPG